MKKKIKIYLHHEISEQTDIHKSVGFLDLIFQAVFVIPLIIFELLYAIGFLIIAITSIPAFIIRLFNALPKNIDELKETRHKTSFQKSIAVFTLFAMSLGIGVYGATLIASGQLLKGKVLGSSDQAFTYLKEAELAIKAEDIARAQNNFSEALKQFEQSQNALANSSVVLKGLLSVIPQKQDGDKLLEAAQLMTNAALDGTAAYTISKELKITPQGLVSTNGNNAENLKNLQNLVTEASSKIVKATDLLKSVSITTLPEDKRAAFLGVRDLLTQMQGSMDSLRDVSSVLSTITLGRKNILLVFQNNNELRATGGFIGTVGNAQLENGTIKKLDIRSVYDFDGQMQEWITPPKPLQAANNRWYLRDSNWLVDFKDSAQRISALYEKEGGETPDMVIAITPEVIVNMLQKTGSITLPQYGITLTAENFVESTQTSTSIAYNKELNQPKQLLADFFPALMQKLGSTEEGIFPLLEVLQTNLHRKNILLQSKNENLQSMIEEFNWGGTITQTERDYFALYSVNLSGTKTDNYLQKNIKITSHVDEDGIIVNTVSYTVQNPLPGKEGLQNMSFLRFMVPKNSKLLSTEGFTKNQIPKLPDNQYVDDPEIKIWNDSLTQDQLSGTFTGTESDKTFFGNWLEVKGGESKTVSITYVLPFKLKKLDRFGFTFQKQPGSGNIPYQYSFEFPGRKVLWQNNGNYQIISSKLLTDTTLQSDMFYGLVLQKQ